MRKHAIRSNAACAKKRKGQKQNTGPHIRERDSLFHHNDQPPICAAAKCSYLLILFADFICVNCILLWKAYSIINKTPAAKNYRG